MKTESGALHRLSAPERKDYMKNAAVHSNSQRLTERRAGLLVPLFSLPGAWGIGSAGRPAIRFLENLHLAGFTLWQILPLGPVGFGNSPYQPLSSFAGDEIYIDIDDLTERGLLPAVAAPDLNAARVDYAAVRAAKLPWLRKAFAAFEPDENYKTFCSQAFWLEDYVRYRVLKEKNGLRAWTDWPETDRNRRDIPAELEQKAAFHRFLQYMFYTQWQRVHDCARELGIDIIGDLPIYVGHDSADVKSMPGAFQLEPDGSLAAKAGCPPDCFTEDGQLWGNPLYDWEHAYDFWKQRLSWNARLYDVVRIDHFLGFDRYWSIPPADSTARNGHWEEGPKEILFDRLIQDLPDLRVIPEDVGDKRSSVQTLMNRYGMPNMKIAQHSLGPAEERQEFRVPQNAVICTGVHDNEPVMMWHKNQNRVERQRLNRIFRRLGLAGSTPAEKLCRYCLESEAAWAILPLQDLWSLDESARINSPGTCGDPNWQWRMTDFALLEAMLPRLRHLLKVTGRIPYQPQRLYQ